MAARVIQLSAAPLSSVVAQCLQMHPYIAAAGEAETSCPRCACRAPLTCRAAEQRGGGGAVPDVAVVSGSQCPVADKSGGAAPWNAANAARSAKQTLRKKGGDNYLFTSGLAAKSYPADRVLYVHSPLRSRLSALRALRSGRGVCRPVQSVSATGLSSED
eukprot:4431788-Prymnesium_polylepis.1